MLPDASAATAPGTSRGVDRAGPEIVNPGEPFPATVVIVPPEEIRRIRLLACSATIREPSGASQIPSGAFSPANTAGPLSPRTKFGAKPAATWMVPAAFTTHRHSAKESTT